VIGIFKVPQIDHMENSREMKSMANRANSTLISSTFVIKGTS
jgi:hypothetical protein